MKKELLLLSILIGSCTASCTGNLSAPAETLEECNNELIIVSELSENCADDLDECEAVCISAEGETVDLTPSNTVTPSAIVDTDLTRYNAALVAEIERLTVELSESKELAQMKYDGLLDEYRKLQDAYAVTVSGYQEFKQLCDLHASGVWQSVEGAE